MICWKLFGQMAIDIAANNPALKLNLLHRGLGESIRRVVPSGRSFGYKLYPITSLADGRQQSQQRRFVVRTKYQTPMATVLHKLSQVLDCHRTTWALAGNRR